MDRLARGVRQPVLRRARATLDLVTVAKASVKGTERLYACPGFALYFASGSHFFGTDQECEESARQPAGNLRRALLPCSNPKGDARKGFGVGASGTPDTTLGDIR